MNENSLSPLAIQLLNHAIKHNLTKWTVEECAVCEYPIHFMLHKDHVLFDGGCTCSDLEVIRTRYAKLSYNELADYIEKTTDVEKLKKIKQFWNL